MTTVLVDMDGTICNLWDSVNVYLRFQGFQTVPTIRLTEYAVEDIYPDRDRQLVVAEALESPGVYLRAEPMPGAIDALKHLQKFFDVFLVTVPWPGSLFCAQEKESWVYRYLGPEWVYRLILTHDKTMVHGDFLIDDKPQITGYRTPSWQQIYFQQGYNEGIEGPRIYHWDRSVAELIRQLHV